MFHRSIQEFNGKLGVHSILACWGVSRKLAGGLKRWRFKSDVSVLFFVLVSTLMFFTSAVRSSEFVHRITLEKAAWVYQRLA